MIILVFDLETNGFHGSSVLEFSAKKYEFKELKDRYKLKLIDKKDNYYLPEEPFNMNAYKVHGISIEKIKEKILDRLEKEIGDTEEIPEYIQFFNSDYTITEYIKDVDIFVGHNIDSFDMSFLKKVHIKNAEVKAEIFDTMRLNTTHMKLPSNKKRHKYKSPNLREACEFYGVEFDENKAHNSKYDVHVNAQLFKKMIQEEKFLDILLD